ncbi:leucine-rich repeat-containing protein 18 [Gouania willdenowi]|uniref:leucine-rich repeat-containing protein 18 n=1 Tax=Gouania willdenowi TaxID=441366 RepID=UPI001055AD9F|nr:leucine-rich repeat-containing protein 18-like [Gouania willdenowi]
MGNKKGKGKGPKEPKVTLKAAKNATRLTPEGCNSLTLSNMGIITFPICLLNLTDIEELDLSRNLIEKLPDNFGDFSSLKKLDLHSNKLESLPESIGNLMSLTHLNLSNNRLTSEGLPSSLGSLLNLKTLNLGLNQLDMLPSSLEALENLEELALFDNLFDKLPEFLEVLPNLTKVNFIRHLSSQKDGEDTNEKKEVHEKEVHLVHESILCQKCQKNEKEESESDNKEEPNPFSGLTTPNSVAKVNQNEWRIKK